MLSREECSVNTQFKDLLRERGVDLSNYENNELVERYQRELLECIAEKEAQLSKETERLQSELPLVTRQSEYYQSSLEQFFNSNQSDTTLLDQLVELAGLLNIDSLSAANFTIELDKQALQLQKVHDSLTSSQKLDKDSLLIQQELSEFQSKLSQSEFTSWGRRDCELGIKELDAATLTVLQKKSEYQRRLENLHTNYKQLDGPIPTTSVTTKLTAIMSKREQLTKIEESLHPYNRLPPDISLATVEIEKARQELERLSVQRDALLKNYR